MLGIARSRSATVIKDWPSSLPPNFLCPILLSTQRGSRRLTRSTRASTSSAPLRPTKRREQHAYELGPVGLKDVEGSQHFPTSMPQRYHADARASTFDGTPRSVREGVASSLRGASVKQRREMALLESAVRDITKTATAFSLSADDVAILKSAEESYFELKSTSPESIDTILAELALAYMHIGRSQEAVRLLKRHREQSERANRHASLGPWKIVLATAFTQQNYALTVQLVRAASAGLNPDDDWAMVARLEAQLRLLGRESEAFDVATEEFWREFTKVDRKPPNEIFMILLRSQVVRGRLDLAEKTLLARTSHGYDDDEEVWQTFLRLHPGKRRRGVLRSLPDRLGLDGSKVFHRLIAFCVERKDLRRVVLAFRMFGIAAEDAKAEGAQWYPSYSSFDSVIHLLCSMNAPFAALRLFRMASLSKTMRDAKYARTHIRLIHAFVKQGKAQEALALTTEMLGISPDQRDSLRKATGASKGLRMDTLGLSVLPSARTERAFYVAIDFCSKIADPLFVVHFTRLCLLIKLREDATGMTQKMHDVLIQSFVRVFSSAGPRTMTSGLNRLINEAQDAPPEYGQRLRQFVETLRSHGFMDRFINKFGFRRPEPSQVMLDNLEWMTKPSRASNGFVTQSEPAHARNRREESESASLSLDVEADPNIYLSPKMTTNGYVLRLRIFAVIRRDHQSAVVIYRHMISAGVKPTSHHIAPIIEGLILNGRIQDALSIREGARKSVDDIDGSMRIAIAIVRGHARLGNWQAVQDELWSMQRRGLEPDEMMWAAVRSIQNYPKQIRVPEPSTDSIAAGNVIKDLHRSKKALLASVNDDQSNWAGEPSILADERPSLGGVISKYVALFKEKRYPEACQFMSRALDAGVSVDSRVHRRLRDNFQYFSKQVRSEGLDVETLLNLKGPNYYLKPNRTKFEEISKGDPGLLRHLKRQETGKAFHWAPILQLSMQNMNRTSAMHPNMVDLLRRDEEAREAMIRLVLDVVGSARLAEEANEV